MPAHFRLLSYPQVVVTTASLPGGSTSAAYSQQFTASGGTPPYTWSIVGGALPPGLSLSSTGVLSGTPTQAGTFAFTVQAQDTVVPPPQPLLTESLQSLLTESGLGLTTEQQGSVTNPNCGSKSFSVTMSGLSNVWFGATLPTLPTQFSTTSSPPTPANTNRGSYYTPGVGGDAGLTLQAALNAAAAATGPKGDVIQLLSGATQTTGSVFTLPARAGTGWIYVITNTAPEVGGIGLPAAGTRVSPANIPAMASLRTTLANTGGPVVNRAAGAAFYRLVGLDIELTEANVQGTSQFYVVNFNTGNGGFPDTSLSTLANNITLDRCYVAGAPTSGCQHAINDDGVNMEVTECYVERCHQIGIGDVNCISVLNSTGPFRWHNNYFDSQGQGTFTGGGDTLLPSPTTPNDFAITGNYYFKQFFSAQGTVSNGSTTLTITSLTSGVINPGMAVLALSGFIPQPGGTFTQILKQLSGTTGGQGTYQMTQAATGTSSAAEQITGMPFGKNAVEFKVGQRVLFDSNYLENAGAPIQPRSAFVLTCRNQGGANPWYVLNDFTITNNVFTNCQFGGFNILLQDGSADNGNGVTLPSSRILIRNNLFILSSNGNNTGFYSMGLIQSENNTGSLGGGSNIIFDHNTWIATTPGGQNTFLGMGGNHAVALQNVVWSNNIWDANQFGILNIGSPNNYAASIPPQVTQPAYINNVNTGGNGGPFPAGNFVASNNAAVGYTSYGSNTLAAGYALKPSSPYHGVGVSGLNQPFNSAGTADGTDAGCNIAALPQKAFQPPSLLTIAQAGFIIVAPAATLTAAGIGVGPLSNPANTQTNAYNVDPTGVADSTAGIQLAINDGCLNYQPIYLPNQPSGAQGIYKITNTLEFYTFSGEFDTAYSETSGHDYLGATNSLGQNPILRASNATGNFTNLLGSGFARPVVLMRHFTGGTALPTVTANGNMNQDPYGPFTGSDGTIWGAAGNGTANVCPGTLVNINIDTSLLTNAGGISINGAQTIWVANLQITATGSVYGIGVLPGNGSIVMNVTVTGGQYGVHSHMTDQLIWQSNNPTIVGLTCKGQIVACVTPGGTNGGELNVIGGDLEPAAGGVAYDPIVTSDNYNPSHAAAFHNVKVVGQGGVTAFKNAGGWNLYLEDVYVSGFTNWTQFAALAARPCTGTWTYISEYAATNDNVPNAIHTGTANAPWPTYNWVNGTITVGNTGNGTVGTINNEPVVTVTLNSSAPPANQVSRHVVTLPLIDTTPFVDIRNFGAAPLSVTGQIEGGPTHNRGVYTFTFSHDSLTTPKCAAAINAAIAAAPAGTAVLIPLGVWEVEGPINLGASTVLMGLGDYRSWIATHLSWVPAGPAPGTPILTTVSNPNATTALFNLATNARRAIGSNIGTGGATQYSGDFFTSYKWQCGGQCYNFGFNHHYQFLSNDVATAALYYRQFQGVNAGGRFYGGDTADSQIGLGCNPAARALYVNGSQQPMYFYSLNLENSKSAATNMLYNLELTGVSNARVYGSKREGNGNTYSVTQNCNNIGLFGSCRVFGRPEGEAFVGATGNSNIVVQGQSPFGDTTATTNYLFSDAGSSFNLEVPKFLSIYKKGTLNDAAMVIGPVPLAFSQVFNFANFSGNPSSIALGGSSGGAQYVNNTISLIPVSGHNAGLAWFNTQVNIQSFTTTFVFGFNSGLTSPTSAGISLRIMAGTQQGDANLCGFGWFTPVQQIPNMVCVKFDLAPAGNAGQATTWVAGGQPSSTGLYINGGPNWGLVPQDDLQSNGINFYSAHQFQATCVYDGTLLTLTLKDLTTNAQMRKSWPVNIPAVVGANTAFVGFGAGQVSNSIPTIYSWSYSTGGGGVNPRLLAPTFSLSGGIYASAQTVAITSPTGATFYYTTNGQAPTTASTLYTGPITVSASTYLQAISVQSGFTDSLVTTANYVVGAAGTPTINFPSGFTSSGSLVNLVGTSVLSGANIQLVGLSQSDVGAAWYVAPVNITATPASPWNCNFTFTFSNSAGGSQGMCFVIQNQPPALAPPTNLTASWVSGGNATMANPNPGLGYSGQSGSGQIAGILSSVAIRFDQFTGPSFTGLYTNGADVSVGGSSTSPVNLAAGHTYSVALSYNGTVLSMTLTDTNTSQVFNTTFTVNIPSVVGANTAFVGFTASTGGGAQGAVAITKWTGF